VVPSSDSADPGNGPPDGSDDEDSTSTDGRQLRRQRNREAVVGALLDLYHEGNLRPSTEEIAERSGLSPRSLFRYFEDVDDLTREAMRRQQERVQHLFPIPVSEDRPLGERVCALVDQRFRLYDAIGLSAVVARLRAPFQPVLAEQVHQNRTLFRGQIERLFAPELAALPEARAARVLAAADVLTTFEACQQLTVDQGLDRDGAHTVISEALTTLLRSSH
jgi:TetR/AcrR family transcriptional regulator, regulator of autoinduction and epiphytic fitness